MGFSDASDPEGVSQKRACLTPGAGEEKIQPIVPRRACFTPGAGAEKIHPIVKTHSSSLTLGPRLPWRGTLYSSGEPALPADFCVAFEKRQGQVSGVRCQVSGKVCG